MKPDTPTKIGDVVAVCTGAGLDARQNPAWAAYPLSIDVVGQGRSVSGRSPFDLEREAGVVATTNCDALWAPAGAPAGAYRVDVETEGETAGSNAFVPAEGAGPRHYPLPDVRWRGSAATKKTTPPGGN